MDLGHDVRPDADRPRAASIGRHQRHGDRARARQRHPGPRSARLWHVRCPGRCARPCRPGCGPGVARAVRRCPGDATPAESRSANDRSWRWRAVESPRCPTPCARSGPRTTRSHGMGGVSCSRGSTPAASRPGPPGSTSPERTARDGVRSTPADRDAFDPSWSPDGRKVVYVDDDGLAVADLRSGQVRRFARVRGPYLARPGFRPDGQAIALHGESPVGRSHAPVDRARPRR